MDLSRKDPSPFKSQYKLISGNASVIFKIKSKLGLFLPDKRWDKLERCTPILSAKLEAVCSYCSNRNDNLFTKLSIVWWGKYSLILVYKCNEKEITIIEVFFKFKKHIKSKH